MACETGATAAPARKERANGAEESFGRRKSNERGESAALRRADAAWVARTAAKVASAAVLLAGLGASVAIQPDTADAGTGSKAVLEYIIGDHGMLMANTQQTMILDTVPGATAVSPDGQFAYAVNRDSNEISRYSIPADGALGSVTPVTIKAGDGPSAITLGPDAKFAYVANQGSNDISQYSVATDGTLAPMTPPTAAAGKGPSALALSPDGKFAYVANAGSNDISQYSVQADGTLSYVSSLSLGAGAPEPVALVVGYPLELSSSTNSLASGGTAAEAPQGLPDPTEIVTDPNSPFDSEGFIIAGDCNLNEARPNGNGDYFPGPDPDPDNTANINGGSGSDLIIGGSSSQTIRGNGGDDLIFAHGGADRVIGGSGNDYIFGDDGADTIYADQDAEDGNATNQVSNDCLVGGSGDDTLVGDNFSYNGTAWPSGGSATDVLLAGQDGDTVIGDSYAIANYSIGGGNDSLSGASAQDTVVGDNDNLVGAAISGTTTGVDSVNGGPSGGSTGSADDTVVGDNYSVAGSTSGGVGDFNTVLIWGDTDTPNNGSDTQADPVGGVRGLDGDDQIWGDDFPASDGGNDWITGGGCATGSCGDVYDRDTVHGGPGNDYVKGDADGTNSQSYSRSDSIYGDSGNDTLEGHYWADDLYGGNGDDSCDGGESTNDWAEPAPSCDSIFNVP